MGSEGQSLMGLQHFRERSEPVLGVAQVVLSTHAICGLSMPDFAMAAKLDTLPVVYSPKWLEKQEQLLQGLKQ